MSRLARHAARAHALLLLLGGALLVRLPLLLTPGYDVRDYTVWARAVHEAGVGGAYSAVLPAGTSWINYPPLYLYVLRATGLLYTLLAPAGEWSGQPMVALVKLGPVLAEVLLGLLLYRFLRGRARERTALLGTAAYLFNPAVIWNTAYWGGIDALHTLFLTLALFSAPARPLRAWPLAALAVGTKLIALPGALAVLLPAVRAGQPRRLLAAAGAALATALLLAAPVLLRGEGRVLAEAMLGNSGSYPFLSANAHNLWWLLSDGDGWRSDSAPVLFSLSARLLGLLLFAGVASWALAGLWRRAGDAVAVCLTGAFLSYAFFLLTTEVHENWGFALFAPLAAVAALQAAYRPLYAALSLCALANLALHDLHDAFGIGTLAAAPTLGVLNAAAACALFLWWGWLLYRVEDYPPRRGRGQRPAGSAPPPTPVRAGG